MDGGVKKNIWVVANWKSNKTIQEALDWISKVGPEIPKNDPSTSSGLKVVVCPTFSALSEVNKAVTVGNYSLMVGSQDLSPFDVGAFTGEESAYFLKELVKISILGHSERRQNFREDDQMIANKVKQALENKIIPLVCVQGVDTPVPKDCKLIAYEPVFAIGTGNPDTPENADQVARNFKERHNNELEVLYGGSVTSENADLFIRQPNIDGILIGGASLNPEEFIKIYSQVSNS